MLGGVQGVFAALTGCAALDSACARWGVSIVDGVKEPGHYVDLLAEIDLLWVISNCPQINNPCNGFDPTPIEVAILQV